MNTVCGWICHPQKGMGRFIEFTKIDSLNVNLSDDKQWDISIDQSSSCTGITVMSTDEQLLGMFDLHRDKNLDSRTFYRELKIFLTRLVAGKQVRFLLYERPVPKPKYRAAQAVLLELKGKLEDWIYEIPEFENARIDSLYPQTWKSCVVDKRKGPNRSNVKKEIAADLSERYPGIAGYFNMYPYKDYDSFDSLGILTGYKLYAFNELGIEMIHGYQEKRHVSFVMYFQAPKDLTLDEVIDMKFGSIRSADIIKELRFLAYNTKYDLTTNIRMASSSGGNVITLLPEDRSLELRWKYGFKTAVEGYNTYAVIYKKGNISSGEYRALKNLVKESEDVYGE